MGRIGIARRVAPDWAHQFRHHPGGFARELWGAYRAVPTIAKFLGRPTSEIAGFWDDLIVRDRFYERIREREDRLRAAGRFSANPGGRADSYSEVLYVIVRAVRPETIVETGVATGYSSASLLQALHDNGRGRLYSIDLPTTDPGGRIDADGVHDRTTVPTADATGAVVPDELRDRWDLTLASSNPALSDRLAQLGTTDIFFHDSDHSYENMMWEYRTAWPRIRPGGYLLSDDITRNRAFQEFGSSVAAPTYVWFGAGGKRGAIRRPSGSLPTGSN